jgi:hypothetical protein
MALAKQTFDFPLVGGLDTRTDPKMFSAPKFSLLENCTLSKTLGALRKRNGYPAIETQRIEQLYSEPGFPDAFSDMDAGVALYGFDDKLLMADGENLWSFSEEDNWWGDRGSFIGWGVESFGLTPDVIDVTGIVSYNVGNAVRTGNFLHTAITSKEGGGNRALFNRYDLRTKETTLGIGGTEALDEGDDSEPTIGTANDASIPVLLWTGSILHRVIASDDGSTLGVSGFILEGAAYTPTTVDTVRDWSGDDQSFDAASWSGGVVWAYATDDGKIRVGKFSSAYAGVATATVVTDAGTLASGRCPVSVSVNPAGTHAIVVYYGTTGTRLRYAVVLLSDMSLVTSNQVDDTARDPLQASVIFTGATSARVIWETAGYILRTCTLSTAGGVPVVSAHRRHSQLASHLFLVNGEIFYHTILDPPATGVQAQNSLFLFSFNYSLMGRVLPGDASQHDTDGQVWLTKPVVDSAGVSLAYARTDGALQYIGYRFSGEGTHNYSRQSGQRILTGPLTWSYSGAGLREHGFAVSPAGVTAVASNGAGTLTSNASYSYRVYNERVDKEGRRTLSSTAAVVTVATGASDDTVTLTAPTYSHHTRVPEAAAQISSYYVQLAYYRTEADGSIFYRVGAKRLSLDPTSDTTTIVDTSPDSAINTNEQDPYAGGELTNAPFPPLSYAAAGVDRIWGIKAEDRRALVYTKLLGVNDYWEHNETLEVSFPEDLRAVGFVNNLVIGFSDNTIFGFAGAGPDNTGSGDFGPISVLNNNVGCINEKTLVEIPQGYVFLSHRGFWLLDRGLNVTFIGSDVMSYNDSTFLSGDVLREKNQVAFTTSTGVVLIYDYEQRVWSVYTGLTGVSAAAWQGKHAILTSTGVVKVEEEGVFTDDGTPVLMAWETGDIKFNTLQGFGRLYDVYLLGEEHTPTSFTFEFAKDYNELLPARTYNSSKFPTVRIRPKNQKCSSYRLKFRETVSVGTQEGVSLNALSFRVGVKEGAAKKPVSAGE